MSENPRQSKRQCCIKPREGVYGIVRPPKVPEITDEVVKHFKGKGKYIVKEIKKETMDIRFFNNYKNEIYCLFLMGFNPYVCFTGETILLYMLNKGIDCEKLKYFSKQNFVDIFNDLRKMHMLNFIHGDIKSNNILQFRGKLYLTDFNLACESSWDFFWNEPQTASLYRHPCQMFIYYKQNKQNKHQTDVDLDKYTYLKGFENKQQLIQILTGNFTTIMMDIYALVITLLSKNMGCDFYLLDHIEYTHEPENEKCLIQIINYLNLIISFGKSILEQDTYIVKQCKQIIQNMHLCIIQGKEFTVDNVLVHEEQENIVCDLDKDLKIHYDNVFKDLPEIIEDHKQYSLLLNFNNYTKLVDTNITKQDSNSEIKKERRDDDSFLHCNENCNENCNEKLQ